MREFIIFQEASMERGGGLFLVILMCEFIGEGPDFLSSTPLIVWNLHRSSQCTLMSVRLMDT